VNKWDKKYPTPPITTGKDGTIKIPAAAYTMKNKAVTLMKSFYDGEQLLHSGGSLLTINQTAIEYEIEVHDEESYFLTANISTWHLNEDLLVSLNSATEQKNVPVYYTKGYWNETQPVEITLLKGKNTLRFARSTGKGMSIKNFLLFKSRPVIPTPDPHVTPAPSPAPSDYIELPQSKTCKSQGIVDIDEKFCGDACTLLGYKYTGSRSRDFNFGCFSLKTGQWAGNCNYNTNTSAINNNPDARSLCLRK
jgi:hypothetical protein